MVNNKIYNTSITNYENGVPETDWIEGPYKEVVELQEQNSSILNEDDCDMCRTTCAYVYGVGCSISGVLTCAAACAPFAGLACGVICGAVWAVICITGDLNTCPLICNTLGYCP